MIQAVIFDIDDTLYNYMENDRRVKKELQEWCAEKLGISAEEYQEYLKKGEKYANDRAGWGYAVNHNRLVRYQTMLELLGKPVIPYAYEMYELYWDSLISQIVPNPGVVELLQGLKVRGTYIGLGSNMTADIQYRKIMKLRLGEYIDGIVTSEEVGIEKPDARLFRLCAEKAGVDVSECVFIGDSVNHDVRGAQAAGMPVMLYDPEGNVTEDYGCPVLHHFSEYFELEKTL